MSKSKKLDLDSIEEELNGEVKIVRKGILSICIFSLEKENDKKMIS